ncbi:MAG TPA: helix-hairpin-helix domain-containing protein [Burkholderiaceae bacterium]|nr:helix-hairpin-helix domain-containing protein [Burkholderiaceae bacterium]
MSSGARRHRASPARLDGTSAATSTETSGILTPAAGKPAGADLAPSSATDENARIAQRLHEMAALLEAQRANPYRVAAYRHAAETVALSPRSVRAVFEADGGRGLDALPGIGPRIAASIVELLETGAWRQLDRLRGEAEPEALFHTIPGVGAELARRLHEELNVDTLESLELAAHDGRLQRLPRIGARRAAAIRAALTQLLDRTRALRRRYPVATAAHEPPVQALLDVDRQYRRDAAAGSLPTIAPRRFNPGATAWLPVLHTARGDWHCTALYSNTARAHELGRVRDWVVLYCEDPSHAERQYTVVTAQRGPLAGRRVVRGRESDCAAWYAACRTTIAPAAQP